jgi:hypothetical protein
MDLMGVISDSINMAFIGKTVIYISEKKFDEKKLFECDDFYELYDPDNNYFTYDERRNSFNIVKRNYGSGMKQYYFELRVFKIMQKKEIIGTRIYMVATEYLPSDTIEKYIPYCQCCRCKKNRTIFKIVPSRILKKFCKCNAECICFKKEMYNNKLLKLTKIYYEKKNK